MADNLWGAVGLTKAVLPSMLDNQEGNIVVISSEEGEGMDSSPEVNRSSIRCPSSARIYFAASPGEN